MFRREYARACALREDLFTDRICDLCLRVGYAARPAVERLAGQRGRIAPRKYQTGV